MKKGCMSAWGKIGSLATHKSHSKNWSDWADAKADLSLPGYTDHFVGFVMLRFTSKMPHKFCYTLKSPLRRTKIGHYSCVFRQPNNIKNSYVGRVKRIWYLSAMRAATVQASLRIRADSLEPPLLAHTSSEWRETFRQKARSLAPLNGWACAVKIWHGGMLEDTNSLDGAHVQFCINSSIEDSFEVSHITQKCVFGEFRPGKTQTGLLNYIDYRKFPKYSDIQKICCNHSKIWTIWLYHRVIRVQTMQMEWQTV